MIGATRSVQLLSELKGLGTGVVAALYDGAVWTWTTGDFSGQADDVNIVKANSAGLTVGAWVRQLSQGIVFAQGGDRSIPQRVESALKGFGITPEQFGAVGDGVADDTAAFQAAINRAAVTGQTMIANNTYLVSRSGSITLNEPLQYCLHLPFDRVVIQGHGRIVKKPNNTGIALLISGSFNQIEGLRFDGSNSQTELYYMNDAIRIQGGGENSIVNCRVEFSKGGGVSILFSPRNLVSNCTISDVYDNSIFVGGLGADGNRVLYNRCYGTIRQNNIFVTSSPGSIDTADRIFDTLVQGNVCRNTGDTCIEIGFGTVRTICNNNNVKSSVAPGILLRDSVYTTVASNLIDVDGCVDGIAVVPFPFGDESWEYHAMISGNILVGNPSRSGIYIGGSRVTVRDNDISAYPNNYDYAEAGTDLFHYGVAVGGQDITDIVISGNRIRGWGAAVKVNFGDLPNARRTRFSVYDNVIEYAATAFDFYRCVGDRGTTLKRNSISMTRDIVFQFAEAVIVPTAVYPESQFRTVDNDVDLTGYAGITPVLYSGRSPANGILTDSNSILLPVPEVTSESVVIGEQAVLGSGIVSIAFVGGNSGATFAVTGSTGATTKLVGSADLVGVASGASPGSVGFALLYATGLLILQRCGAATGLTDRWIKVVTTTN